MEPVKVLVVDDSRMFRTIVRRMFEGQEGYEVVGEAENGRVALAKVAELDPDVVVLDVNMPVMDGLTCLKHIMIKSPRPVVMFSTLTEAGARVTFDSLAYGAVDFIHKPSRVREENDVEAQRREVLKKVLLASRVQSASIKLLRTRERALKPPRDAAPPKYLFAMGASDGGYGSLLKIIPHLSPDIPGAFVAVLYEEPGDVDAFARYLDEHSHLNVRRAGDDMPLSVGTCYLATGEEYVTVETENGRPELRISRSPFPGRRGSTNMLMFSMAEAAGENAVGILLSGSGEDGMEGLSEITRVGGTAVVQSPRTCLEPETVRMAMRNCNVHLVVPDRDMSARINKTFAK
ncbi:MAG: chemotaxis protein CheB [Desulfatibacillaceae bacterium]